MKSILRLHPAMFPVIAVIILFFLLSLYYLSYNRSFGGVLGMTSSSASVGIPVRLSIPSINMTATIESVGEDSSGSMGVPHEIANVAWFNSGPRPGEEGSSVIAGHYGWEKQKVSAFDRLHYVRIGDTVYVTDKDNNVRIFVVEDIRKYGRQDEASDAFTSNDGQSRLNLITCYGTWNTVDKNYPERLVVFTTLVR